MSQSAMQMGFRLDSMPVLVGGRGGEGERETERRWGKERVRRTQIKYISEKASSLLNASSSTLLPWHLRISSCCCRQVPSDHHKTPPYSLSCGVTKQPNNQFRLQTEEEEKEGWDERGREGGQNLHRELCYEPDSHGHN